MVSSPQGATCTPLGTSFPYDSPGAHVYSSPGASQYPGGSYTASPLMQPVHNTSRAAVRRNISRCIVDTENTEPTVGTPLGAYGTTMGTPLGAAAELNTGSPMSPPLAISSPFGPSLEGSKFSLGQETTRHSAKSTKVALTTTSDHSSLASLLSRNSGSTDSHDQSSFSPFSCKSETTEGCADDSAYKTQDKFSSFDDLSTPSFFMQPRKPTKSSGAIPKDRSRMCHSSSSEEARSSAGATGAKSGFLRHRRTPERSADPPQNSKRRLADFWEKSVLAGCSEESDTAGGYIDVNKQPFGSADIGYGNQLSPTKHSVVMKSYYDPEGSGSHDRVKRFLEATKQSSDQLLSQPTLKLAPVPPGNKITSNKLSKSSSNESLGSEVKTGIRVKRFSNSDDHSEQQNTPF